MLKVSAMAMLGMACTLAAPYARAADANTLTADIPFSPDFVQTVLPQRQQVAETIPITGKLSLDKQQSRIASARVSGRLGRIFVFEGQSVKAGAPLAEIYSPDYIAAENEYLLAKRFRDSATHDSELSADTQATFKSAANKLTVLGASAADIAHLEQSGTPSEYLQVRAPISGVVIQRNVDPGGYLNVGDALMTLANMNTLWLFANTYDADYPSLRLGETLAFKTPSLPDVSFSGKVAFIAPSIDAITHTLPIRCDVPNPDLRLRAEMFVSGLLTVGQSRALVVPKSAVIHIRDSDYVIVQDNSKQYRRVAVKGHAIELDRYAITAGLSEPLPVVSDGALLLNEAVGED